MEKTRKVKRFLALALAVVMVVGLMPHGANAQTIADGSKTCTVKAVDRNHFLTTDKGTRLGASYAEYTTNDGLTGPAYCIDHGLKYSSGNLEIRGVYETNPETAAAFAQSYPQHSLETFLGRYPKESLLKGLTEEEYAYATQLAIWATLGQLAVEGTKYTNGRETVPQPVGDEQQIRVFRTLQLICESANWSGVPKTGMIVRAEEESLGANVALPSNMTLEKAAERGEHGIKKETIGGKEYYTREFTFASATSTYYSGYNIELWAEGAPEGTIFASLDNVELGKGNFGGKSTWVLPTDVRYYDLMGNGFEYSDRAKLCIPVEAAKNSGEITVCCGAYVMQYQIYLAYNKNSTQQSYIIADPSKGNLTAKGSLSWGGEETETGSLRVTKTDEAGQPLAGAKFTLSGSDGSSQTGETDSDGFIKWNSLDPDVEYTLTETQAPAGYMVVEPQKVTVIAGQITDVTVQDPLGPKLTVKKVDAQTGYSLRDAVIAFEQIDGDYYTTAATDQAGSILMDVETLPLGSYKVYEVTAPEGYELNSTPQTVNWDGTQDITLTFNNVRKPTIEIYKCDENNLRSLPDATFEVYRNGQLVTTVTTNDNGLAYVPGVTTGYYTIKEVSAPEGYVADGREYGVYVDNYDPATTDDPRITVTNAEKPSLTILKYDAQTMKPVPDVTFEVYHDGQLLGSYTTDASGKIELSSLDPGTYLVKEVAAKGYVVNSTPQEIEIEAGSGRHSTATGELNNLGTFYSDENGQFFLDELRDGWYRVTELEPAAGYTMKEPSTQEFYIRGGESKTVTFENTPKNAIIVEKYDSVTGEALAGCTFQLRFLGGTSGTGGTVIGTKVTGKNGVAMWTGLNPGTYIVEEIDPADGYNIIQSSETILLADNGEQSVVTVRFLNSPDGMLLVRKVCSVNPSVTLAGAEFKISYADGTLIGDSNGIFVTDEKGEIRVTGLKPGKSVIVTETRAPAGFILDSQSQTVQIKEGRVVSLTFRNQPKGAIVVKKVDSATGKPLSGAEFRITTSAGCEVGLNGVIGSSTLTQNGIFTTDSNGEIKISNLAPGTYVLTEIKAPDGYVMDTASTNVVIGNGGDTQIVTVKNSKAGTLIVDKRDSRTGKPLEGVQFRITTASGEFVPDENGRLSSNGIYFTNKDGQIVLHGVVGTLVVTETVALPGYTMDNRPQTVVVKPNDTQTLYFTNTPSTTLVIEKYIEATTTPLKGVTFLVTDSSGAVVGKSNGEYITDENGRIVIEDLTPGTTVTAKEVKVPDGFVLDTTPKSILIKEGEVQTLRFYNKAKGTLVIQKKDSVTGALLSGAKFQLTYADGSFVDYDNGHMSSKGIYVTDENGEIRVYGVVGTIVAKELEAAPGYVIDPKTQTVAVNAEDTQTLVFRNEPLVSLTITKLDSQTHKPVPNTEFTVTDSNGSRFSASAS